MRRIAQGFVALTFFGCGGDTSPASPAAEVVDSAGVTIVTSQPGSRSWIRICS
ncbi:MAG: hypothetical protein OXK77_17060 [Gemmatimonadota bacterium]|nr:hypothetical protein [Gemmatimonadota bacterium]MDE2865757.1 hypothetical protein [Gemmatimonadota bacterium]